MNFSQVIMSIRKEIWEYKNNFLWLPLIIGALLILIAMFVLSLMEEYQAARLFENFSDLSHQLSQIDNNEVRADGVAGLFMIGLTLVFSLFLAVGLCVQLHYLLASLFDERRDLSVYFWRSLPVPDITAVGAKLLTGSLVIPSLFMGAATLVLIIFLFAFFIFCMVLSVGYDISIWSMWWHADILSNLGLVWVNIVPYALWMFPVYAWLMLASAFANKSAFLWAALPIILVLILESILVEYSMLDSVFFRDVLSSYFQLETGGYPNHMNAHMDHPGSTMLKAISEKISIYGILIGCGFMYGTYWLRAIKGQG